MQEGFWFFITNRSDFSLLSAYTIHAKYVPLVQDNQINCKLCFRNMRCVCETQADQFTDSYLNVFMGWTISTQQSHQLQLKTFQDLTVGYTRYFCFFDVPCCLQFCTFICKASANCLTFDPILWRDTGGVLADVIKSSLSQLQLEISMSDESVIMFCRSPSLPCHHLDISF